MYDNISACETFVIVVRLRFEYKVSGQKEETELV